LLRGGDFALPDDIKACAMAVLRHRVRLAPELDIEGLSVDQVLQQLIDQVPAPRLRSPRACCWLSSAPCWSLPSCSVPCRCWACPCPTASSHWPGGCCWPYCCSPESMPGGCAVSPRPACSASFPATCLWAAGARCS